MKPLTLTAISLAMLYLTAKPIDVNAQITTDKYYAEDEAINAVLRTATIYVRDWDESIKFYTGYLRYKILVEQAIKEAKSLKTLGAEPGTKARIAYLKANSSNIARPFTGNYLGLIELLGSDIDTDSFKRQEDSVSAVWGEVVLAHQVVGIETIYKAMKADGVLFVADLSLSGAGKSRSFSVIDPNGIRVELYEFLAGQEPVKNP